MTTHSTDGRADATRRQILRAASHQFARRPYHDVGLDDILAEAQLTKGAMYFHFKSKHALAVELIDKQIAAATVAVGDLLTRGLSGLETLIDFSYLIAVQDIKTDLVRAGLNLIESVGQTEGVQDTLMGGWVEALSDVVQQAITEGDIDGHCDPDDVGRLMVSLHMGLRKTSNLDEPERFLLDLEKCWMLILGGILQPDRTDYFRQFLRRRAALAVNSSSADEGSP
ncbi:TetR/AcrR family transcriptional regulator [Mycobacterium nebraskense]|uniref:TetR family transcriptional regulator n=1 Tax=Mycobacterium nebraskense TaxID=244292 RepID=A0A0F5NCG7_9MYCO|nr:TetR/AcrR family transcriptional regulator [Mycobacterium nebraskense]KKC04550.1 TetR family transcriptional regulator [Mycobacterium nebraskense]KLO35573.1 TetR family transcriptional regulator [Mycobacterium nebraskense]MBI2693194.1 TetR/AcrR family transcriptional regulator [Mycobacterium nebraskense]MCV7116971.1 TetR/AcrR family transcriptional regulator [Mycobacterium nebraskense]ORW15846.1 TetR family transcriptional regulator [Mycobacterium nebraskense]